jgi:hypothetical protein
MTDKTAPNSTEDNEFTAKIYNSADAKQLLKVNFNDTMATDGKYSVLDLDKYEIDVYTSEGEFVEIVCLADIKGATIKAVDGGKAVEIKVPSSEDKKDDEDAKPGEDYFDIYPGYLVVIAKVADVAGNKTQLNINPVTIDPSGRVGLKSDDSIQLTAKDTITITLNDRLSTFKSGDFKHSVYEKVVITGGTTTDKPVTVSKIKHTVNSDGQSVVTLTLTGWDKTISEGLKFKVSGAASKNAYGETVKVDEVDVADKAAPIVEEIYFVVDENTNENTIEIVLSEAIAEDTVAKGKSKNGFSVSGGKAKLDEATVTVDDGVAKIILKGENFKETTDVSYNDVFGLEDEKGNALKSFTRTDKLKPMPAESEEEGEDED